MTDNPTKDVDGERSERIRVDNVPSQEWEESICGTTSSMITEKAAKPQCGGRDSTTESHEEGAAHSEPKSSIDLQLELPGPRARVRIPSIFERASSHDSFPYVLSSCGNSSYNENNMEPALTIDVNPQILNEDKYLASIKAAETLAASQHERATHTSDSIHCADSTSSTRSVVDREVIVTNDVTDSLEAGPTPLGRARRLSLFERANSVSMSADGQSGIMEPAPSESFWRRRNLSSPKGADYELSRNKSDISRSNALRPSRGAKNTIHRDWLMHVLEKDDQHDAKEVQNVWAAARRRRRLAHETFEGADYELYDSKVWHTHKENFASNTRQRGKDTRRNRKIVGRWLTIALGVAVGLTGCFVTFFTELIVHEKLHFVAHIIETHSNDSDMRRYGIAFAWLLFINSCLSAGAFGLVWYQPWSSGSGIPETKCVLNGVSMPQVFAPSTLVCKIFGVIFGVASGLPIGKEGPMIHAGAAIGGSIANLPNVRPLEEFRNDRDRRDLAAMGTAAGVAAAFRTPIGGVLFALEEGASFWTTILTWRSFAAAVVTVVVYYLVFQGRNMFKQPLEAADIFLFGEFQDSDSSFFMWELTVFALIATVGGLIGAGYVACSKRLALLRARHLRGASRRLVEIMVVNTIMTTLAFFLPLALGECRPVPTDMDGWSPAGMASLKRLVTLNCHHHEYNELGTLFLNEQDGVIKLLFHFGAPGMRASSCILFSGIFITMQCVASGVWVSSGLFIPSILTGAAAGRGMGEILGRNSRAYALVGAAGVLGGISRMTLSVTVMMVEASGWVLFVIPLMLVFITARSVGNKFNEGIYDTQISVKKMPFLEQEPPEETRIQNMRANQLMSKEVVCLRPIETVEAVLSILRDYNHNCFPVVEHRDQRVLLGVIHRKNLSVLLKHRHFQAPAPEFAARTDGLLPVLSWDILEKTYPGYPQFHELQVRDEDMDCKMDLAAYVQIGPHTINEHASAHRAYIMFRTLGLRHLVVVNHYNEVMGIITRENLLPEHFAHGGAYHTSPRPALDKPALDKLAAA